MNEACREMTLKELFDTGNFEGIEHRFDKQEEMRRDFEKRCQCMAQEQVEKARRQVEEKEETIQTLLKCLRILGK